MTTDPTTTLALAVICLFLYANVIAVVFFPRAYDRLLKSIFKRQPPKNDSGGAE